MPPCLGEASTAGSWQSKTLEGGKIPALLCSSWSDLARIIYELVSRDRGDGLATGQPQGLASEAYLNSTSQGARPEDAWKDVHIRGRSSRLVSYPG